MSEESLETPEADAAEQHVEAVPDAVGAAGAPAPVPLEADALDAAEQAREVPVPGDEDYR
jgi:hypothetical protein